MKILHIAHIRNNPFNGVCVVVPAHVIHQSKLADVALLNIIDCKINGVEKQFVYTGADWRKDVSEDFKKPDIVVFHEVYHIQFVKIAKSLRKMKIPYVSYDDQLKVAKEYKMKLDELHRKKQEVAKLIEEINNYLNKGE